MARFQISMGGRMKRSERAQLLARIDDLELRVRLLEARLRAVSAQSRPAQREQARRSAAARRTRPRPRCPGCLLELPTGKRRDECVWCGFRFEAARPITFLK